MKRLKDDNARLTTELKTVSTRHEKTIKDVRCVRGRALFLSAGGSSPARAASLTLPPPASPQLHKQYDDELALARRALDDIAKVRLQQGAEPLLAVPSQPLPPSPLPRRLATSAGEGRVPDQGVQV